MILYILYIVTIHFFPVPFLHIEYYDTFVFQVGIQYYNG